jgi:peptide deformylase
MMHKAKRIVPVGDIPLETVDVPLDDLVDVFRICLEMEMLCELHSGIGLAAAQVGIPWRLFIVKSDGTNPFVEKGYGYFINCNYEPATDAQRVVSLEGCLSVRSEEGQLRHFQVERFNKIIIKGFRLYFDTILSDLKCESIDREVSLAEQGVVFQHENDHQFGRLISDHGIEVFLW